MDSAWLLGLSGFAFAMAGTPGPNNTMATASGIAYGMARTMAFLGGVTFGVAAITLAVAAFGASVISNPTAATTLKWAGLAYLLWLAWKIASADPASLDVPGEQAPKTRLLGFIQGALVQFINPKLWVMVSGAVVAYGHSGAPGTTLTLAVIFASVLGGMTFVCTLAWAGLGAAIGQRLKSPRSMRAFNISMAVMLVLSLVPIVLE